MARLKRALESVMGTVGSVEMEPSKNEEVRVMAFAPTGVTRYARGTRSCARPMPRAAQRTTIAANPFAPPVLASAISEQMRAGRRGRIYAASLHPVTVVLQVRVQNCEKSKSFPETRHLVSAS